jgi:hypothetical protein
MPYHIGAKGSNGCSGYPVLDDKGKVAGCHTTEAEATAQLGALYANVPDATKGENSMIQTSNTPENPSSMINPKVGMKKPQVMPSGKKKKKYRANKSIDFSTVLKDMVGEGDFVLVSCDDGIYVGIVQYVMTEGMFGIATSDYAIEASMENPAVLVRTLELEEDEGIWEESEYLVGAESKMVTKIEPLALEVEVVSNGYQDCGCATCEVLNVDCENCPVCSPMPSTNSEVGMAMYDSSIGKAKKPNYGEIIKPRSGGSTPSNPKLYARVVQAAKDKFDVYPSAVANSWVVQEYKRRGGTYKSDEPSTTKSLWDGSFDPNGIIK